MYNTDIGRFMFVNDVLMHDVFRELKIWIIMCKYFSNNTELHRKPFCIMEYMGGATQSCAAAPPAGAREILRSSIFKMQQAF